MPRSSAISFATSARAWRTWRIPRPKSCSISVCRETNSCCNWFACSCNSLRFSAKASAERTDLWRANSWSAVRKAFSCSRSVVWWDWRCLSISSRKVAAAREDLRICSTSRMAITVPSCARAGVGLAVRTTAKAKHRAMASGLPVWITSRTWFRN